MVVVEICVGSSCYVKGSNQVVQIVKEMINKNNWQDLVEIKGAFCMQMCTDGLGVKINGKPIDKLGLHNAEEVIKEIISKELA